MIFQDPFSSLNPRMTVGSAVAEPMIKHRIASPSERVEKRLILLERVGCHRHDGSLPARVFRRSASRVAIARALALNPKVIVADESVSALDVSIKAQVCNLLMDLQEQFKIAFLFISHDMAVVERVSHRVAVMYLGEIVEIGPRTEIFANPQHAYTKKADGSGARARPSPPWHPAQRWYRRAEKPCPQCRLCRAQERVS